MARRIGGQVVTIVRRERGSSGALEPSGQPEPVRNCFVEPKGTAGGDDAQAKRPVQTFRVYGPELLASVRSTDQIQIDGQLIGASGPALLERTGEPAVWPDRRGRIDHVELDAAYTPPAPAGIDTITVVRVSRDRHGDPVGQPAEHVVPDCVIDVQPGKEDMETGEQVTTPVVVYVRSPDADVRSSDRVRLSTDPSPAAAATLQVRAPWRVVGDPAPWRAVHGTFETGLMVHLERVSG